MPDSKENKTDRYIYRQNQLPKDLKLQGEKIITL